MPENTIEVQCPYCGTPLEATYTVQWQPEVLDFKTCTKEAAGYVVTGVILDFKEHICANDITSEVLNTLLLDVERRALEQANSARQTSP